MKDQGIEKGRIQAQTSPLSAKRVKRICIESGADDVGVIEIKREVLSLERENILRIYPKAHSIISIVKTINSENVQSPARYLASDEFKNTRLSEISRVILRRLNEFNVRGLNMTPGFPMDMDRWPGKTWDVSHKLVAVEAGLGHMGHHRNLIHPTLGNFVFLNSILIDAQLDQYDKPLLENPCIDCKMCVAVCPVGAIGKNGSFDFFACSTHNYREFLLGFQDWVDALVTSEDLSAYRSRFNDSESLSMWQSLAFRPNNKCSYCMAVCPAGEDVVTKYLSNKKQYVQEVLRPLKDRQEPVYVIEGSRAETIAQRNPNKKIRRIRNRMNSSSPVPEQREVAPAPAPKSKTPKEKPGATGSIPINCHDTVAAMPNAFNPDIAGNLSAKIQFHVSGADPGSYYLRIEMKHCTFHEGKVDAPTLTINTPSEVWLAIAQGTLSGVDALMQGKYKAEGDLDLLIKMQKIFQNPDNLKPTNV